MTNITANDIFRMIVLKANKIAFELETYVICVYAKGPNKEYGRKYEIEQVGSGIAFKYKEDNYIATARHVIDTATRYGDKILFFNKNRKALELKCEDIKNQKMTDSENEDYAIFKIENAANESEFYDAEIINHARDEKQCLGIALGFPCTKNKQRSNRTLDMKCLHRIGMIYPNDASIYVNDNINSTTHVAMEYGKFSLSTDGTREISVGLHGMSGGSLFGTSIELNDSGLELEPFLLGITIEYGANNNSSLHLKFSILIDAINNQKKNYF